MVDIESELPGFQSNPNSVGKCSSCGKKLMTKKEAEITMCKDCQKRHRDKDHILDE
ncbi:hypothetical protein MUO14_09805 [Halobacillus shinanisalinarum]|uniref:YhfH family protein n=1 Tax=Halobacillus shinanisalinarum TaxID=2932258 RepID=A0ABY4H4Z1_9BACI|nr:hypothetical protein [Halobacillus shinanisalinarum]UOQ95189.1 hypothetical protein MUO14_09805 [Halobacillus shinanisalinarum]